ncbi:MAG: AlpA family transcriptional regulator [SAR86 cluster bacterium]|uniref:AlpA family transcriptional regulator n=1 Tax=SAR86 cluster bacterium TaxID=2030880 RepID=A0A2A5CC61_9GAMM|nr:AlpA family phage regulatory protein [Gammaproteobacteria bacterium AH-315-E17]PCJ41098.1 MAG: AlpA family transcriptional regulator [SAR86 cluster bacterium]
MRAKILRLKDVIERTGLSRSTIYLQIAQRRFPRQLHLTGARSIGWHEDSITQWIESRKEV